MKDNLHVDAAEKTDPTPLQFYLCFSESPWINESSLGKTPSGLPFRPATELLPKPSPSCRAPSVGPTSAPPKPKTDHLPWSEASQRLQQMVSQPLAQRPPSNHNFESRPPARPQASSLRSATRSWQSRKLKPPTTGGRSPQMMRSSSWPPRKRSPRERPPHLVPGPLLRLHF